MMVEEPYTPSLEVVKVAYKRRKPGSSYMIGVPNPDPEAEFDRFVAAIRAQAWDEGAEFAWQCTGEGHNAEHVSDHGTHDGAVSLAQANKPRNPSLSGRGGAMKAIIQANATRWAGLGFSTAWLLATTLFAAYEVFDLGSRLVSSIAWIGVVWLISLPAMLAFARQSRRAAGRAYELGKSDGQVEAWSDVRAEAWWRLMREERRRKQ